MVKTSPSNAEGTSLILGQGTKILHALRHGQKKKKKNQEKSYIIVVL